MVERNTGVAQDQRLEYRIGVHLGDVVEEADGDLMGDGVNIAARIESVADPGGICLSEDAWRQVRDKVKETFVDRGEKALKNIARPVRIYAVSVAPPNAAGAPAHAPAAPVEPARSSIAVLPFANMKRRCRTGIFRRRHFRGHHHGVVEAAAALRHRPQFRFHLQGQERQCRRGRQEPRRPPCA
jgi:hypothetical protein